MKFLAAPLQQNLTMKSANNVYYKQCAMIEFLVVKQESGRNSHKHLCNVYGVLHSTEAPLVTA